MDVDELLRSWSIVSCLVMTDRLANSFRKEPQLVYFSSVLPAHVWWERNKKIGAGQGVVESGVIITVVQNLMQISSYSIYEKNTQCRRYWPSTEKNNWRVENVFTFYLGGHLAQEMQ